MNVHFSNFKRIAIVFFLLTNQVSLQCKEPQNYVTYDFSGGRFGDNLMAYLHAKWIAYKNEMPLLYKPFPNSSQLMLHLSELPYSALDYRRFKKINLLKEKDPIYLNKKKSRVYVCPYFPECGWERSHLAGPHAEPWAFFNVEWKDPVFNRLLKDLVRPIQNFHLIVPPKDTINIAIHIREGGTYDTGDFALHFLTKFPTVDFYIEGLLNIIKLFPQKPLYCYLFTDAVDPLRLIEQIRAHIPIEVPITFDCRFKNNSHDQNILEDFFSFFNFDVLIHPQSNFSVIPSLIHNFAVVYAPLSAHRKGKVVQINKVKFEINESIYQELLK